MPNKIYSLYYMHDSANVFNEEKVHNVNKLREELKGQSYFSTNK